MKYVVLLDGTMVENCSDSTTSNSIFAIRSNYEEAGAVRDTFTKTNAAVIRVFNEEGTEVAVGSDLVLLDGANLIANGDGTVTCEITTRAKTELEKMHDEISELQDVVVE